MTPRPKERLEERSDGLVVVRYEMTKEQKKQRRADNRAMKLSRELHRASNKHGQRQKKKLAKVTPTFKDAAKAKHKAKRNDAV